MKTYKLLQLEKKNLLEKYYLYRFQKVIVIKKELALLNINNLFIYVGVY